MAEQPEEQPTAPAENGHEEILAKILNAVPRGNGSESDEQAEKPAAKQDEKNEPKAEEKKPSKLKQLWAKSGLDL